MALLATVGICLATFTAAAMMTQSGEENAQSNALYEDMETLNMLYEELCWDPDVPLEFKADYDNNRIIITTKEKE